MSRERFDDPLDGVEDELRRALAIEPSPEFMPRVRVRIAAERPASGAWLGWRAALAGAALGAMALALVWNGEVGRQPRGADVQEVREVRRGQDIALAPEPAPEIGRVRAASVDRPAARVERRVRAEPEILVPPDAALALARVLELARAGALREAAAPPAEASAPTDLVIAPIVVPSVPVMNVVNVDSESVVRDAGSGTPRK